MKRRNLLTLGAILAVAGPGSRAMAQTPTPAPTATPATAASSDKKSFTDAQLDQMLAPIALYPDALLSQILMASTYSLEVVEAARWSKGNPTLKGDAALAAVKDKGWDASVASLVAFPQVLEMMNDKLDWVQNVGDAMIAQQGDVAGSIQRLRAQARTAGTLKSTPQQTVTTQPASAGAPAGTPPAIVIEPANPETVYVPTYNPNTVYGTWPYADYPPTYFPPRPSWGYGVFAGALGFGIGYAVGRAFFGGWGWGGGWGGGWHWGGWRGWGWHNSYTTVNIDRATYITNNFNRNIYHDGRWSHDPAHRHGVPYRDRHDRERYGQHHPGFHDRNGFRGHDHGYDHGGERHNGINGVNHGQRVNHEAGRGHSYNNRHFSHGGARGGNHGGSHHASHGGGYHGGGGHRGGGGHGGGHGGRR